MEISTKNIADFIEDMICLHKKADVCADKLDCVAGEVEYYTGIMAGASVALYLLAGSLDFALPIYEGLLDDVEHLVLDGEEVISSLLTKLNTLDIEDRRGGTKTSRDQASGDAAVDEKELIRNAIDALSAIVNHMNV